jgi:hypothetical protein
MRKLAGLLLMCILCTAAFAACQRPQKVEASGEATAPKVRVHRDLHGELSKIDPATQTIVIRVDNGMEQTVKLNESTSILTPGPAPIKKSRASMKKAKVKAANATRLKPLFGWEGSEVIIPWSEDQGMKLATSITVSKE